MKRSMLIIMLGSVALVFLFGGVTWADHGSKRFKTYSVKHVEYAEYGCSVHKSKHKHHRGGHHATHHPSRHYQRHPVVHHHRPVCQHNHRYRCRPQRGVFHLGGIIVDPGWFFSFGIGDRW